MLNIVFALLDSYHSKNYSTFFPCLKYERYIPKASLSWATRKLVSNLQTRHKWKTAMDNWQIFMQTNTYRKYPLFWQNVIMHSSNNLCTYDLDMQLPSLVNTLTRSNYWSRKYVGSRHLHALDRTLINFAIWCHHFTPCF